MSDRSDVVELIAQSRECSRDAVEMLLGGKNPDKCIKDLRQNGKIEHVGTRDEPQGERLRKAETLRIMAAAEEPYKSLVESPIYTTKIRNDPQIRERYHEQSETIAMMNRIGVPTLPSCKPPLYGEGSMEQTAYYQALEVKAIEGEKMKMRSSRIVGLLRTPNAAELIFCFHSSTPKWEERTERRVMDIVRQNTNADRITRAIIGKNVNVTELLRGDGGEKNTLFKITVASGQTKFIPFDDNGLFLLKADHITDKLSVFVESLIKRLDLRRETTGLVCDGVDTSGVPHLIALDYDLYRIKMFRLGLESRKLRGVVYCFDFQKDVMTDYFEHDAFAWVKVFSTKQVAERIGVE